MIIKNQQKGELEMIDELNKLIEAVQVNNNPENLAKLKAFVEKEAKRELAEIKQNQWLNSKEQILGSILPTNNSNSQAKENWLKLIEHIRKRLIENDGKIIKLLVYSSIWSGYLFISSIAAFIATTTLFTM